jgi:hypothetical protein
MGVLVEQQRSPGKQHAKTSAKLTLQHPTSLSSSTHSLSTATLTHITILNAPSRAWNGYNKAQL